jgi:hypothetical protein
MHTIFKTLNLAHLSAQMTAKLPFSEDSPPRQILVELYLRQKGENIKYKLQESHRPGENSGYAFGNYLP